MNLSPSEKTTPRLASDILQDLTLLLKTEVDLARAEMKQNLRHALSGLVAVVIGAAVLIAGLTMALLALAYGLVAGFDMAPWLANLIAALVGCVIGGGLVLQARGALDPERMAPTRATESLRKDASVVKETFR